MEPKQQPPYPLRMPPELRQQLEESARSNGRSLNAEIVARLTAAPDEAAKAAHERAIGNLYVQFVAQEAALASLRGDFFTLFEIAELMVSALPKTPSFARRDVLWARWRELADEFKAQNKERLAKGPSNDLATFESIVNIADEDGREELMRSVMPQSLPPQPFSVKKVRKRPLPRR